MCLHVTRVRRHWKMITLDVSMSGSNKPLLPDESHYTLDYIGENSKEGLYISARFFTKQPSCEGSMV